MRRARHCWLVLTGRIDFDYSTEKMEFYMAFEKTTAAVAALTEAANNLIAKCGGHEAEIAQLKTDLAAAQALVSDTDDQTAAAIQAETDAINAAAPAETPPAP